MDSKKAKCKFLCVLIRKTALMQISEKREFVLFLQQIPFFFNACIATQYKTKKSNWSSCIC